MYDKRTDIQLYRTPRLYHWRPVQCQVKFLKTLLNHLISSNLLNGDYRLFKLSRRNIPTLQLAKPHKLQI